MAKTLPRITARVDDETQHLLTKAAALAGMPSMNSFVLSAAVEKAKKVLEQEQLLNFSQEDAMALMAALDNPATLHTNIQAAAARYQDKS